MTTPEQHLKQIRKKMERSQVVCRRSVSLNEQAQKLIAGSNDFLMELSRTYKQDRVAQK